MVLCNALVAAAAAAVVVVVVVVVVIVVRVVRVNRQKADLTAFTNTACPLGPKRTNHINMMPTKRTCATHFLT
jgi:hypothetical protein